PRGSLRFGAAAPLLPSNDAWQCVVYHEWYITRPHHSRPCKERQSEDVDQKAMLHEWPHHGDLHQVAYLALFALPRGAASESAWVPRPPDRRRSGRRWPSMGPIFTRCCRRSRRTCRGQDTVGGRIPSCMQRAYLCTICGSVRATAAGSATASAGALAPPLTSAGAFLTLSKQRRQSGAMDAA
ncbi:MAG: hypothetical protein QOG73_4553, partial [Acetobacteraceae bacterium]|nr:hypothetical protein [Acetobacteraceae bacterium]